MGGQLLFKQQILPWPVVPFRMLPLSEEQVTPTPGTKGGLRPLALWYAKAGELSMLADIVPQKVIVYVVL